MIINHKYLTTLAQALSLEEAQLQDAILRASAGNEKAELARLQAVFQKAARGETVTVAAIGGSITQGVAARTPKNDPTYTAALDGENCWFNRVTDWFREQFRGAEIRSINAGIGATPSFLGGFRLERMVLQYQPDLIFVEFSVNDPSTFPNLLAGEIEAAYEAIVRRSLEAGAAVVPLFLNDQHHCGLQAIHRPVAEHYRVPYISYHDAISPEGQHICPWELLSPDDIHPNNVGHTLIAACICSYLDRVLAENPVKTKDPIPEDWVYGNIFYRVEAIYGDALAENVTGKLVFHTDTRDCTKWFGTLVSEGGGTVEKVIPKGARRVWVQYYYQNGSFETAFNGQQTSCNTAPIGWPRPMWFRVYTGAPLPADTTLTITTHKAGTAVIMAVLIAY